MSNDVKKEKNKKHINLKAVSWSKVGIIFGLFIAIAFFIAGVCLVGIYYNNFQAYQSLVSAWKGPGFEDYLNSHNNYASTYANETNNQWVHADYSMFALGLSFLILGLILIVIFSLLFRRNKKKNSLNSDSYYKENQETGNKKSVFKFKK